MAAPKEKRYKFDEALVTEAIKAGIAAAEARFSQDDRPENTIAHKVQGHGLKGLAHSPIINLKELPSLLTHNYSDHTVEMMLHAVRTYQHHAEAALNAPDEHARERIMAKITAGEKYEAVAYGAILKVLGISTAQEPQRGGPTR